MSLLDKYKQDTFAGDFNTSSNNDLLSKYSSTSSISNKSNLGGSIIGNIKPHLNSINIRGINQDNFSIVDKMRGIQGGKIDIDNEISLTETYLDKSLDTKVMGGLYSRTITDMYQNERLFKAVQGLYTDGIIEEKENYVLEQEQYSNESINDITKNDNAENKNLSNSNNNYLNNKNIYQTKEMISNNSFNKEISGFDPSLSKVNVKQSTIHNNIEDISTTKINDKNSFNFQKNSYVNSSFNSFMVTSVATFHSVNKINSFNTFSKGVHNNTEEDNIKLKEFNQKQKNMKDVNKYYLNSNNFTSHNKNINVINKEKTSDYVSKKVKTANINNTYNKSMSSFIKEEKNKKTKQQLIEEKSILQEKLASLDKNINEIEYNIILKKIDKIEEELLQYLF